MRISAYARATNPKYSNFAVDWAGLATQLGTKAGKALSTSGRAAKLGAGVGAGIGAVNYLGSEDKSIGNLAGQVAGGAALGGAVGYGSASLKNAYQARKAGQVDTQIPSAPQAQLSAAQPVPRPQPIQNGVITTPAPTNQQTIDTTAITVPNASGKTQSGNSQPYPLANQNTQGVGQEQNSQLSQLRRPDVRLKKYPQGQYRNGNLPSQSNDFSKSDSPFANFKVRRYNGFVY